MNVLPLLTALGRKLFPETQAHSIAPSDGSKYLAELPKKKRPVNFASTASTLQPAARMQSEVLFLPKARGERKCLNSDKLTAPLQTCAASRSAVGISLKGLWLAALKP